ncbi:MAG: antibiotic biosynthesis monooxygenase [Rhodoferax sp.]|uniref:antibiotic biosynthesis monooxygenase family protein n=1 Tax=Rhodoferax sp. TaxID=50421 RepID=UPI002ACD6907|nr:antibiotic biosynthesis monooxygenase [Rhodoferax sp.]MDZ7891680.1 antibiotic biosynthesis monooxygenase [Rhodoferax sp.]
MSLDIADTPPAPYYAVIFTSLRTAVDEGYGDMAEKMVVLAAQQPGFLGMESARDGLGITVSYWKDLESIRAWKAHAEHQVAQQLGHEKWYAAFETRIAKVERDYAL